MVQTQDGQKNAEACKENSSEMVQIVSFAGGRDTNYVHGLIQRLPRHDPIARLGREMLERPHRSIVDITPLLTMLGEPSDYHWRQRVVAAWTLGQAQLRPEQYDAAVNVLLAVLENRQVPRVWSFIIRCIRAAVRTVVPMLCGALIIVLLPVLAQYRNPHSDFHYLIYSLANLQFDLVFLPVLVVYGMVMPFYSLGSDIENAHYLRAMAAWALGSLQSPQSIPMLAEASTERNTKIRLNAQQALSRLLPVLRSEDYGQLGAQTVPDLCRLLYRYPGQFWLSLPILEALQKIGDARAIPAVEYLEKNGHSVTVREAAAGLLPVLYERRRQESHPTTLLRASDVETITSPDVLLRAAPAVSEADPQELLRATTSEPR